VETIESRIAIQYGTLHKLSTQRIVSCDKTSNGCAGGQISNAYQFIMKNNLIPESNCPFNFNHL